MESQPKEYQAFSKEDLPIFIKWMDFLKWLMVVTDKFPKKSRFTFTDRMVNLALAVVEDFVDARYSRNKSQSLRAANMKLEKLRMLVRISYEQRLFSRENYEKAALQINEVGKMIGGWIKQQDAR
jgi:four helix bundle protein